MGDHRLSPDVGRTGSIGYALANNGKRSSGHFSTDAFERHIYKVLVHHKLPYTFVQSPLLKELLELAHAAPSIEDIQFPSNDTIASRQQKVMLVTSDSGSNFLKLTADFEEYTQARSNEWRPFNALKQFKQHVPCLCAHYKSCCTGLAWQRGSGSKGRSDTEFMDIEDVDDAEGFVRTSIVKEDEEEDNDQPMDNNSTTTLALQKRWGSSYTMLVRRIKYKVIYSSVLLDDNITDCILDEVEWRRLNTLKVILERFDTLTTKVCASKIYATITITIVVYNNLMEVIENFIKDNKDRIRKYAVERKQHTTS
ncbi:hypothetical protein BGZ91_007328 [Linnemannia elongata]|nr:hypothetical protein BGZ91_007328 [Linnemannia elongata]